MNTWQNKLIPPSAPDEPLYRQVTRLFEQQRSTWELFRNGEASLSRIVSRRFTIDGNDVVVQANPGRSISTNANVDAKSIANRPCFLCSDALPPQERGVAFGNYIVLPNPYPVLPNHCTIAFHRHEPQRIESHCNDLCTLARALGSDFFVLYNGPQCGASAPDHLHFQACSAEGVPLFDQLPDRGDDNTTYSLALCGRNVLTGYFSTADGAARFLDRAISKLKNITGGMNEPMINIIARLKNDRNTITLFPRAKHRSACFFAEAQQRLSISPAAVEMAGVIVVADESHFDRVDAAAVQSIYREVTLDDTFFSEFVKAMQ
ncbi:MAG: DUF4922 domain-containing protein [Chitinispirillaceae bacterium]|nr:DUF4922 domain-containing protein [Chitinispirillaceae bacterium]